MKWVMAHDYSLWGEGGSPRGELFIGNLNDMHGECEIKPTYDNFIEKNKCIRTNDRLENRLVYLY